MNWDGRSWGLLRGCALQKGMGRYQQKMVGAPKFPHPAKTFCDVRIVSCPQFCDRLSTRLAQKAPLEPAFWPPLPVFCASLARLCNSICGGAIAAAITPALGWEKASSLRPCVRRECAWETR